MIRTRQTDRIETGFVLYFFFSLLRFFCLFTFFFLSRRGGWEKKKAPRRLSKPTHVRILVEVRANQATLSSVHTGKAPPNPGTKQNGQRKKNVFYIYRNMMVVGRTWQTVVSCVCAEGGMCEIFFCFLSDYFFPVGGVDGWTWTAATSRTGVALRCVVSCCAGRKEVGMMYVP